MENSVFPASLEESGYFATFRGDVESVSNEQLPVAGVTEVLKTDDIAGRLLTE
jgi:hypothetical protein